MSDISVSDVSTFALLQELMLRKDDEGDSIFSLNALPLGKDNALLITGIAVKKPMYLTEKKQEPIQGSQVPPVQTNSKEEEE